MDTSEPNNRKESLRQNDKPKSITAFFPQDTSAADINKVVLKLLKERQEMAAKKEQTEQTEKREQTEQTEQTESCETEDKQQPTAQPGIDNDAKTKARANTKKKIHEKPQKTCSFCKQTGHQRRECPRKLYPGLNIDT